MQWLLAAGIFSSVCYVGANVVGPQHWPGYSSFSQAVSELSAVGAPSRPAVLPWFAAYSVGALAFGAGVWLKSRHNKPLRRAGFALLAIGIIDLAGPLFPMNLRGAEPSFTDVMHIAVTALTVVLILLAMIHAASALGKSFRLYSIATIIVMVAFGTLAGLQGGHIATGEPTPWLGVTERINIGSYLLWQAVLAVALLRSPDAARPDGT